MRIEMSHRDYSAAVLIGRFQPFHNNHKTLVEQALRIADKVLILVGSSHAARTPKNPFTFEERRELIGKSFPDDTCYVGEKPRPGTPRRIAVEPIRDYFYSDDMWLSQVQAVTSEYIEDGETVALLGAYKDSSSYYLNMFPQWEYVAPDSSIGRMDATSIREALFDVEFSTGWADRGVNVRMAPEDVAKQNQFLDAMTPAPVADFLKGFTTTETFTRLSQEFKANRDYRAAWEGSPFPPIFVTADAVVTCSGHVLVVTRGGNPGKGLLALPGGFVRSNERIKDAAVRELKEETRIKVDKPVLKRAIVDSEVFDYPARSERGRTITHAFHIKLEGKLPEVKLTGADDAVKCQWMPFVEVMRRADEFFEDHIHIINNFITS
jgi:bifunctional NMN adenylyltransferase/nudix hydrolase